MKYYQNKPKNKEKEKTEPNPKENLTSEDGLIKRVQFQICRKSGSNVRK